MRPINVIFYKYASVSNEFYLMLVQCETIAKCYRLGSLDYTLATDPEMLMWLLLMVEMYPVLLLVVLSLSKS